jgi:hypothetical protein
MIRGAPIAERISGRFGRRLTSFCKKRNTGTDDGWRNAQVYGKLKRLRHFVLKAHSVQPGQKWPGKFNTGS